MKGVAYILLLYFSFGALMPKTDFSQLLKLNDLMEHYKLHQQEAIAISETISFSKFLYIHFIGEDSHEHENKQEHDNLPFQTYTSSINFHLIPQLSETTFTATRLVSTLPFFRSIYKEEVSTDIFQPPIFA